MTLQWHRPASARFYKAVLSWAQGSRATHTSTLTLNTRVSHKTPIRSSESRRYTTFPPKAVKASPHPQAVAANTYGPTATADDGKPTSAADNNAEFLRTTTVASFLNLDNMPAGRWIQDRMIAELLRSGTRRIRAAIAQAAAHSDPADFRGKDSARHRRINKLIERLHRANKVGTVDDVVMQEVLIGGLEGGAVEARLRARRESKGTGKARLGQSDMDVMVAS